MSAHFGSAPHLPALRPAPLRATRWDGWFGVLRRVLRTVTTRQDLLEMEERMLRDIGLTRAEAAAEASRAPWEIQPRRL